MAPKRISSSKLADQSVVEPKLVKTLTEIEYEQLERYRALEELQKSRQDCIKYQTDIIELKKINYDLAIKALSVDKFVISENKKQIDNETIKVMAKKNIIHDVIRKRLSLNGKFGYNPDTLEIVE